MRCATRISERIGDTEIDHLSGRAEAHHAYLVYVTESKRWSPAVRTPRDGRYDPFPLHVHARARAREIIELFAFRQPKMGNWPIICCDAVGLPINARSF